MLLWWTLRLSWMALIGFGALLMGGWMKVILIIVLCLTSLCATLVTAEVHLSR